ncbi:MAG TPA: sigma-54 dependent transcriptional regulator [Bauldia sp.]|nr:sigma-54 dependent transcriptional regulator [Bauldia sp.]
MTSGKDAQRAVDVVILDEDPAHRRMLSSLIAERTQGRFQPHGFGSRDDALAAAKAMPGAILLVDVEAAGGLDRIPEIARAAPRIIATSSAGSLQLAVAAVKAGACDFLPKPIGARGLIERLESAVADWREPAPAASAAGPPGDAKVADFAGFIGRSAPMLEVYARIQRMAPSRAPVFITGESGTGKELCAEAIHRHAGAPDRPFVAINCSAIPKELMESEIFGHVRGAFTGATEDRPGAAELADGGTLFLDEIAEMDLALQAKLLRFVQSGTLRRVGANELRRVEVRIVSATNRDPLAEVEAGRFRADLFYRLHVLPVHLAPLRERREDIMPLAEAFLARFAAEEGRAFRGFDAEAAEVLLRHEWTGNVRQLENAVRQVVVLHDGEKVTVSMLPSAIRGYVPAPPSQPRAAGAPVVPFREQERAIIENALAACGGSIPRAAAALEISPSTIYRKRQAWSERRRA